MLRITQIRTNIRILNKRYEENEGFIAALKGDTLLPSLPSVYVICDIRVICGSKSEKGYCVSHNRSMIMTSPIHPGEILLEEYLKPLGVSQNALARSLGITPKTVSEIVLGKRGISPEMSIRLGKFFGQSPRFWLNLQTEYAFPICIATRTTPYGKR